MNNLSAKKQTKKHTTKKKTSGSSKRAASAPVRHGISPRVKSILYVALAIVFGVMIFVPGSNIWTSIRAFFFGIFGMGMLLIPPLFIYLTVINEKENFEVAHFKAKIGLCILLILMAGAFICSFKFDSTLRGMNYFAALGTLYKEVYTSMTEAHVYIPFSCGLLGGLLGYPLAFICGGMVAGILSLVAIIALIFILTNLSVKDVARAAGRTVNRARQVGEEQRRRHRERVEERRRRAEELEMERERERERREREYEREQQERQRQTARPASKRRHSGAIDIPLDEGDSKRRIARYPGEPEYNAPAFEEQEEETEIYEPKVVETPAENEGLGEDLLDIINRADPSFENADKEEERESVEPPFFPEEPKPEPVKKKKSKGEPEFVPELENAGYHPQEEPPKEEKVYHYPPVQLLSLPDNNNDQSAREELEQNSRKLIDTLTSFGVNAKIVNICRGPSVTRYELQPAPGVKISKITNLSDDIALNLAANGVRIEAPIPGKAAVGIEVPNKVVSMVSMRELIDSDKFRSAKSKLTAVLGRDISGEIVVTDIAKMPHLLIAGTTGSGKSVCVNSILISILYKANPDEVKLLLIDPKMVEFSKYKGIPHLLVPIVSDAKKAAGALGWAVNEMLNRYKIFSEYDCKDIDSYNSLIERNLRYIEENEPYQNEEGEWIQPVMEINGLPVAKEKMSRVVIAIDELADLMMAAPSEVEDSICRLAQMARAAGMHLILATQRPTVNVITGLIKANVPSRIALKVSSNMDSRTILDTGGGEKLIGRGDMLFSPVGAPKPMRVQGCYASEEEIERVTGYIKKSSKAEYNAEIEESIKRIATEEIAQGKKSGGGDADEDNGDYDSKIEEAIQCVIEAGQASTSLVQRRLKVGYARAGRMIDEMEQLGIVGPHQGSKPRDVLMTYNEWLERRNVLQNNSD